VPDNQDSFFSARDYADKVLPEIFAGRNPEVRNEKVFNNPNE